MDIRQLTCFLAVVEHDSVTKAANSLHLAQPSLSQTIRTLERDIGAELFHRIGRRLVLSPAGRALIDPARQILRDAATARSSVQEVLGLESGRLEIASLSTLAVDPLAALIGSFRLKFPNVAIKVIDPEGATEVEALVRTGGCELGVTRLPLKTDGLVAHQLLEQELLVVISSDFPVRPTNDEGGSLSLLELAALPWVASRIGTSTRATLDEVLSAVGATPWIAVETGHREAIVPLVLEGSGASLLPASLALSAKARGARVVTTDPVIRRRVGLVHRQGPLSPAAHEFVRIALASTVTSR